MEVAHLHVSHGGHPLEHGGARNEPGRSASSDFRVMKKLAFESRSWGYIMILELDEVKSYGFVRPLKLDEVKSRPLGYRMKFEVEKSWTLQIRKKFGVRKS